MNYVQSPEQKKLKMNDLRQTLTSGQDGKMMDGNLLTFHEKVDTLIDEQDILRSKHLSYLKEAAQLLTQEGELISALQDNGGGDDDIDGYVNKMEVIVARNLEIYSDMQQQIRRFKTLLNEEEEAHKKVGSTFYY
jgi:hypothetical protein